MIYNNNDAAAVLAMEDERTGHYGDYNEYQEDKCPVCGAIEPYHYYLNDDEECVGCSDCLRKTDILI